MPNRSLLPDDVDMEVAYGQAHFSLPICKTDAACARPVAINKGGGDGSARPDRLTTGLSDRLFKGVVHQICPKRQNSSGTDTQPTRLPSLGAQNWGSSTQYSGCSGIRVGQKRSYRSTRTVARVARMTRMVEMSFPEIEDEGFFFELDHIFDLVEGSKPILLRRIRSWLMRYYSPALVGACQQQFVGMIFNEDARPAGSVSSDNPCIISHLDSSEDFFSRPIDPNNASAHYLLLALVNTRNRTSR
jgi:hypothetical protein